MEIWINYKGHKQEKIGTTDNTIYSFDIETTSYIVLNNKQINSIDYLKLTDDEKQNSCFQSTMYIWMFSINESVYYGRTWNDFIQFMELLRHKTSKKLKKYIFVHNLSWEFEYLRNVLNFDLVFARKSRKVIKCTNEYFNIEFRCTYFMTNVKLEKIPKIYGLETKKLVGNLEYSKPRHSETKLSKEELQYCENDCLVIYEYIKLQLKTYKSVSKLPLTSTGFVRRELKKITYRNFKYERKVQRAINTDGHIFNLLNKSFMRSATPTPTGFLHGHTIKNVTSFDFTSSYPYVMLCEKFPSSPFKKCRIKSYSQIKDDFCYIVTLKLKNPKCKYFNNFISQSKCEYIKERKIRQWTYYICKRVTNYSL